MIQLSSTEESESESEFKSEEEEINNNPNPTPENLHTMDAITNCESKLSQDKKDLLDTKKSERRSIRIRVTKTTNKLLNDITTGNKFAVTRSVESLSEALKDLERKDEEIWTIYDDDAVDADMKHGEPWTEKGLAAITDADEFSLYWDISNWYFTHP